MEPQTKEKMKQTYEKPKLRIIELAAEEVLGIGCKTTVLSSPGGAPPCTSSNCSQLGS